MDLSGPAAGEFDQEMVRKAGTASSKLSHGMSLTAVRAGAVTGETKSDSPPPAGFGIASEPPKTEMRGDPRPALYVPAHRARAHAAAEEEEHAWRGEARTLGTKDRRVNEDI